MALSAYAIDLKKRRQVQSEAPGAALPYDDDTAAFAPCSNCRKALMNRFYKRRNIPVGQSESGGRCVGRCLQRVRSVAYTLLQPFVALPHRPLLLYRHIRWHVALRARLGR